MNQKLQELFDGLNHLCETNEAFYFAEQNYEENYIIRSFTYRLATWTDFQLPYALDCRGTAFTLNKQTNEWSLFCRGYQKFFNLGEGIPKEDYIKNNTPLISFEKLDGSLILFGEIEGKLVAKSKTSINSDHAKRAQELVNENNLLQNFLYSEIDQARTPILELVGPEEFRIVLNYTKDELVYLGSVENINYNIITSNIVPEVFRSVNGVRYAEEYDFSWSDLINMQETSKPTIEGFVVKTESGLVKCKVNSYVHLHHLKDNINNEKNLIALILDDNLDDIIGQFQDNPAIIEQITEMQTKIAHNFNHLVIVFKELRRKYFQDFNENRKEFSLKYSKEPMFGNVMKTLRTSFRDVEKTAEEQVKLYISKKCNTQSNSQKYLNSIN